MKKTSKWFIFTETFIFVEHFRQAMRTFKKVYFDYATARNKVRCYAAIIDRP